MPRLSKYTTERADRKQRANYGVSGRKCDDRYVPVRFRTIGPPGAVRRAYSAILHNFKVAPRYGLDENKVAYYTSVLKSAMKAAYLAHSYSAQEQDFYRALWDSVKERLFADADVAAFRWMHRLGLCIRWSESWELSEAIRARSIPLIRFYAQEQGSDVNHYRDALTTAAHTRDYDIIKLVIDLGALPQVKYSDERHALCVAAYAATIRGVELDERVVQLLLEHGGPPSPAGCGEYRGMPEKVARACLTYQGIVGEAQENCMLARCLPEPWAHPATKEKLNEVFDLYHRKGKLTQDEWLEKNCAIHLEYYRNMPRPPQLYLDFYEKAKQKGVDKDGLLWVRTDATPDDIDKDIDRAVEHRKRMDVSLAEHLAKEKADANRTLTWDIPVDCGENSAKGA